MNLRQYTIKDFFFTIVFLLLLAGALLSYDRIQKLIEANNQVTHTNSVKMRIEQLRSIISEGESAQRGYLLTHDTVIFRPYKNSFARANLIFDDIDNLTQDNHQQNENSLEARLKLNRRFDFMNRIRDRFEKTGNIGTDSLQTGKLLMDDLRNSLLKMELAEDKLLQERMKEKYRYESLSPLLILIFTLLILAITVFTFRKIRNDRKQLRKINESLETKNEELVATKNFLQLILDSSVDLVGSLDTELNYITVNIQSKSILGFEPEEIIGRNIVEMYPAMIGTDTHKALLRAVQGEYIHIPQRRGISNSERFFETFFIPLFQNKKVTGVITIVRDITALIEANENLKEKNAELERSIKELASFNYIASHDLQEPLRKIQLFSDRITEESANELPEKVKQNFERITAAASRMRRLIEALLSYSLAGKKEIEFEKTDLDKIVTEIKEQILEDDIEKNIFIDAEKLPVANVIPVQFQQLFLNLLSNAVKYRRPNTDLFITITTETVTGENAKQLFGGNKNKYLKITVSDNGIGFPPEYADKIFGLFQRLHTRNEYSGTGIGLAICRKIMENHQGYITALGREGNGAAFDLYFPL